MTYDTLLEGFKRNNYEPIDGNLSIISYDSLNMYSHKVSGNYKFKCFSTKTGDTISINGDFKDVIYDYLYEEIK